MDRTEAMTAVLQRFAASNPELANGFAEHAPMGAEALLELGVAPEAVVAWAAKHRPTELPAGSPIGRAGSAIRRELEQEPWAQVVRRHAEVLIDRLDAHLFHGLIRTAHAVRSLEHAEDELRRHELAMALAAWTVWAEAAGPAAGASDGASDGSAAASDTVLDAAHRGAGAFLATPNIVTIHAVTAPMAFLALSGHLDDAIAVRAAAAFERSHRRYGAPAAPPAVPGAPDAAALAGLVERWDAHPAKLVEAALRGHRLRGDGVFLAAAAAMLAG